MSNDDKNAKTIPGEDNTDSSHIEINPEEEGIYSKNHNDLLNDLSMDLTVEIGRAKMKISELLNLSKGTIIHLDQQADEPLNIYANNKCIAKGHIISANGKYCIRVI
ncbi:MAG: FliM/FliN family flagellar motor switch protein [Legionellales bacterium]